MQGVKFGMDSFRIRLIYAHLKTSVYLQNSLAKAQGTKRKKTGNNIKTTFCHSINTVLVHFL